MSFQPLLEAKGPLVVVLRIDLPAFRQHSDIVALLEIIDDETAIHIAPDAVTERYAVAVRVVARHCLGDADGDARLRYRIGRAREQACRHEDRRCGKPSEPRGFLSLHCFLPV